MQKKTLPDHKDARLAAIACAVLTVLGFILFTDTWVKPAALLAGALSIYLLATRDLKPLRLPAAWLLLGYVVFTGFSAFWAMSGKFFLREYMKVFIAAAVFLFVALREKFDAAFARKVASTVAGSAAIYALFSVEGATIGLMKLLERNIPTTSGLYLGYQGVRLFGVFGNSNIEATVFGIGILLSVALLCGAASRRERILDAVLLSFNAYAFLLVFSMLATACFALAILCYLIAAGKQRAAALIRMLEAAIPTALCAVTATTLFNRGGVLGLLPLLLMFLNAAISAFLELRVAERLISGLDAHGKLVYGVLIGLIALVAVYVIAGVSITGAYTFGDTLSRAAAPAAGEHTLTVEADGEVQVTIYSQSDLQVLQGQNTPLYEGGAQNARFTVPEGSDIVTFNFSAPAGTTISAATLENGEAVPLDYPLLPSFAANRIQGIWASSSVLQRIVYMQDGIKLWRRSPVIGYGVGAFETGITSVQEYYYESRYIHNHYIQILVEDGVIGFALWVAALLAMGVALVRRRSARDGEYGWLYGALWAGLVMLATQTFVDVSLSYIVPLAYAYALFALIVRVCEPEPAPVEAAPKKAGQRKKDDELLLRVVCCALPCVFAVSVCMHIFAAHLESAGAPSFDAYMANLATSAKIDPYEYNDFKLTYLTNALDDSTQSHLIQADRFAKELSAVQSNSLPLYLMSYYLQTGQYEYAIDEAMQAARFSASNQETWTVAINLLRQTFWDDPMSPLITDSERLLPKLLEYRAMLAERNETAQEQILVLQENFAFLMGLDDVAACENDPARIAALLNG